MSNSYVNIRSLDECENFILEEIGNRLIRNELSPLIRLIWEDITVESWSLPDEFSNILSEIPDVFEESFVIDNSYLLNTSDDDDDDDDAVSIHFENNDDASGIIEMLPVSTATDINSRCTICLENYEIDELLTTLPCTHSFHKRCLEVWLRSHANCPICRQTITT